MPVYITQHANWLFLAIVFSIAGASINLVGSWRLRRSPEKKPQAPYVIEINLLTGLLTTLLVGLSWRPNLWAVAAVAIFVWSLTWLISLCFISTWMLSDRLFLVFFILSEMFYFVHKLVVIESLNLDTLSSLITLALMSSEVFTLIACTHSVFDVLIAMNIPPMPILSMLPKRTTEFPLVSLHVPVCREPPSMVVETLNALALLDYPNYEVIVISNNTNDERLWRPVEARCKQLGFCFYHFDYLDGYKAGALNQALLKTNKDADLIGIVDSDNIVRPDFLCRLVNLFDDLKVGFVQTRQDYRKWQKRAFLCGIYPLYQFFYDVVMVTRNTRNSVIFCGSMGLMRANVLRDIRGWDEWCITEDAEASLRILQRGYKGTYVNESFGFGLLPQTFGDMKKQWSRWTTGAAQIIRKHNLYCLFTSDQNTGLSFAQRWDYIIGGSISFGAVLMLMSTLFLVVATILIVFSPHRFFAVFSPLSTSIAIFSYFLALTGMITVLALKVKMKFPWKDSLFAFCTLLALSVARGLAFLKAFTRRRIPFQRTPKFAQSSHWTETMASVREELIFDTLAIATGFALVVFVPPDRLPSSLLILLGWQIISCSSALYIAIRSTLS
jgi:cellulose synthase/poly-beta-1,6-N-acetylglucosamine synthase-like glycosyltransferase